MKTVDLVKKYIHIFSTNYTQDVNCQGAWLFSEGSGSQVADSSQNSNTGNFKAVGSPVWSALIPAPYCLYSVDFDGINDFIDCGTSVTLDIGANHTQIGWFYNPGTLGQHQQLMGKREGNCEFYNLQLWGQNNIESRFKTSSGSYTLTDSVPSGQWNSLAFRKEGNRIRMFVNGVDVGNTATAGTAETGKKYVIGAEQNGTGYRYFFGDKAAEQAVFNRQLDTTEINDIIDNGLTGIPPSNPWPVSMLNKNRISGYHCFMDAYMRASREGFDPLKLPDGTIF